VPDPARSPRVSVIVIAYNAEPYITQTLDHVLAQTYRDFELIVVDDGSRDGTAERIRAFGDRVTYLHQPNSGACSKPRNTGIEAARGDILAFIDSDDLMAPDRLANEVAFLDRHPDVGLVFSNYKDFTTEGIRDQDHFASCPQLHARLEQPREDSDGLILVPADSTELLLTETFGSSSPTLRRDVVARTGGFDEGLKASEDYEFQFRVASQVNIAVLPRVGWLKRSHSNNMSSNTPNILKYKIITRQRILDRETEPRRRRKLRGMLATYYSSLAYYHTGRDNSAAWRCAMTSLRLRRWPDLRVLARLLVDVLGRDTNRTAQPVGG